MKETWRSVDEPPSTGRQVLCRSIANELGEHEYWLDKCQPKPDGQLRAWVHRRPHVWRDVEPRDNSPEFNVTCAVCFDGLTLAPKMDPYEVDRAVVTDDHRELEPVIDEYVLCFLCEKCAAAIALAVARRRTKAAEP